MEPNNKKNNPIKKYLSKSLDEFLDYANNSLGGAFLGFIILITIVSVVMGLINMSGITKGLDSATLLFVVFIGVVIYFWRKNNKND